MGFFGRRKKEPESLRKPRVKYTTQITDPTIIVEQHHYNPLDDDYTMGRKVLTLSIYQAQELRDELIIKVAQAHRKMGGTVNDK